MCECLYENVRERVVEDATDSCDDDHDAWERRLMFGSRVSSHHLALAYVWSHAEAGKL